MNGLHCCMIGKGSTLNICEESPATILRVHHILAMTLKSSCGNLFMGVPSKTVCFGSSMVWACFFWCCFMYWKWNS